MLHNPGSGGQSGGLQPPGVQRALVRSDGRGALLRRFSPPSLTRCLRFTECDAGHDGLSAQSLRVPAAAPSAVELATAGIHAARCMIHAESRVTVTKRSEGVAHVRGQERRSNAAADPHVHCPPSGIPLQWRCGALREQQSCEMSPENKCSNSPEESSSSRPSPARLPVTPEKPYIHPSLSGRFRGIPRQRLRRRRSLMFRAEK